MPAPLPLPESVPAGVRRWQTVWHTGARAEVLRALLVSPRTFDGILEACESVNRNTGYAALMHLIECGYVTDDAPAGVRRRPSDTVFYPVRSLVMADLGAVITWLG